MARVRNIQTNFTAGELSPKLEGRVDLEKYFDGVKTLENFIVHPHGGAKGRPGTRFVAEAKYGTKRARAIPFEYSTEQAYMLEFGDQYIRFFANNGRITTLDSYTKALIHGNGNDASQVFTDVSPSAHSITTLGNAKVDTEFKHLGNGSIELDGVDSAFKIAAHADFDYSAGKFGVEVFARRGAGDCGLPTGTYYSQGTDADNYIRFYSNGFGNLKFVIVAAGVEVVSLNYSFSCSGLAAFNHVAVMENDNDWYLFLNGVLVDSATDVSRAVAYTGDIHFGAFDDNITTTDYLDGHLDETRVSNGVARYTAEFIPTTVEFDVDFYEAAYEIASPYLEEHLSQIKYTQSADVLFLVHPLYQTRKLSRTANASWTLKVIDFAPPPSFEKDTDLNETLTPGATTGNGITFTAGSGIFLAADVDRHIKYGDANAVIKSITDASNVVCDIISDFPNTDPIPAGDWFITGSPVTTCTPDKKEPVGATVTLTLTAAGWRSADVGKYVHVNGGLVKITIYSSTTVVSGIIQSVLSATTGATAWTLEVASWSGTNGYPSAITFYEDRLFLGGTTAQPDTIWGSKSGDYENMAVGSLADDAVEYTILSNQVNTVKWLLPSRVLFAGTTGGEFRISGGVTGPITPSNIEIKSETTHGSSDAVPVRVENTIFFIQRAGRKVRGLGYVFERDAYGAPDATILSEHITKGGIKEMSYQQEPNSILWFVRGKIIGGGVAENINIYPFKWDSDGIHADVCCLHTDMVSDALYLYTIETDHPTLATEITIRKYKKSDLLFVDSAVIDTHGTAGGLAIKFMQYNSGDGHIYLAVNRWETISGGTKVVATVYKIHTDLSVVASRGLCLSGEWGYRDRSLDPYCACSGDEPAAYYTFYSDSFHIISDNGGGYNAYVTADLQERTLIGGIWAGSPVKNILKIPLDLIFTPNYQPVLVNYAYRFDHDSNYLYAVTTDGRVYRWGLATFGDAKTAPIPNDYITLSRTTGIVSLVLDATYIYVLNGGPPGCSILRVSIEDWAEIDELIIAEQASGVVDFVMDAEQNLLYVQSAGVYGIWRINISDFTAYDNAVGGELTGTPIYNTSVIDSKYFYEGRWLTSGGGRRLLKKYVIWSEELIPAGPGELDIIDGMLLGLTFEKDQKVFAWHKHITDGDFESIATIPHPDGNGNQTWHFIRRDIDGVEKRYVEYFDERGIYYDQLNTDCSFVYEGPAKTTLSNLGHLEGKTVRIIGDGAVYPDQVVSGGVITISPAANKIEVGLAFLPKIVTLRPAVSGGSGTIQSVQMRISNVTVRLFETLGVTINGQSIPFRTPFDAMDASVPLFTGDKLVTNLGWGKEQRITIEQRQSLPVTVLAIMGVLDVGN